MSNPAKKLEDLLQKEDLILVDQARVLDGNALAEKAVGQYQTTIEYASYQTAKGCGSCQGFDPGKSNI